MNQHRWARVTGSARRPEGNVAGCVADTTETVLSPSSGGSLRDQSAADQSVVRDLFLAHTRP